MSSETNTLLDRRAWIRCPSNLYTLCQLVQSPGADPLPARVNDISPGGINLYVKRPIEAGTTLSVLLPGLEEGSESNVLAHVNNVRLNEDGQWSLGCTFALELDDETLGIFGGKGTKPAGPDQRSWVRFPCAAVVRYQQIGPATIRGVARVLDLAPMGIGLLVEQRIPIGTLFVLEVESPSREVLLTILASVVRLSSQQANRWRIGCTFVRELTENELKRII